MRILAPISILLITASSALLAEAWPTWGRPSRGSKYSPLNQINRDNVTDPEVAWTYRTGDFEGKMARFGNSFRLQSVPFLLPEK
jgi:quinoprotein glucose dehydrogenase